MWRYRVLRRAQVAGHQPPACDTVLKHPTVTRPRPAMPGRGARALRCASAVRPLRAALRAAGARGRAEAAHDRAARHAHRELHALRPTREVARHVVEQRDDLESVPE
jgi:hypothetical protein